MITENQLKRFVGCGQAAQKAVDKILAQAHKDLALAAAAQKAKSGKRKDLQAYLKLRRELL